MPGTPPARMTRPPAPPRSAAEPVRTPLLTSAAG